MKIHEYQAKELFQAYGIPVPEQRLCKTPTEAGQAALAFGGRCVIKAQAHAGGRGKAGGVKVVSSKEEAEALASRLIGSRLVTHQSGAEGSFVPSVLVTPVSEIRRECYLALTFDAESGKLAVIACGEGGTEIETLSKERPQRILTLPVSLRTGLRSFHIREVAAALGLDAAQGKALGGILTAMVRLFIEKDCSLVEINPLIVDGEGKLLALDAKINFDDNALFRHPDIAALRDATQEEPHEAKAREAGFSYVKLDGNIGCLVNGAGLAMATLDIIKSFGGAAANFLDVGGSATVEKVTAAFELILSDPNVKAILVNIFGGIMKCDVIAEGVVEAARKTNLKVPLIVRLKGTNLARGREILKASNLPIIPAEDFREAVEKAVQAAKGDRA